MATYIVSVHPFRRTARQRERQLQASLDLAHSYPAPPTNPVVAHTLDRLHEAGIPAWARGVRVEKAGLFQWAVVATENRGH